jgi:O-Antigen ligase
VYAVLESRILAARPRGPILALFGAATAIGLVRAVNQPSVTLHVSGTGVAVVPGDIGFLALALALVVVGRKPLLEALRRNRLLAGSMTVFSLWLLATAAHNGLTSLTSGVKVVEPVAVGLGAMALLDSEDRLADLVDLILGVTLVADVAGLYTYIHQGGGRVDSFLGTHDFSALATLPLLVVLAGLFAPGRWSLRTRWLAGLAGWLGLALTAALTSLVSLLLGVIVLFWLAWRHHRLTLRPVAQTLVILAVVVGTTITFRHNDLAPVFKWLGNEQTGRVSEFTSSWHQRLIYVYVGGRIFVDRPLTGTGWWGQPPPATFARYIPAARRRFPSYPRLYFPPTDRPFTPQQTYDQVLYELGLIGALLLLAAFAAAGRTALLAVRQKASSTALDYVPALWFAGLIGALAGEGLFGGNPLTTLLWLTLGVATYRVRDAAT